MFESPSSPGMFPALLQRPRYQARSAALRAVVYLAVTLKATRHLQRCLVVERDASASSRQ